MEVKFMKQKVLAVLLATAMTAGMLAGCGGSSGKSGTDANTSETNEKDAESTDNADDAEEAVDENEDGTVNNPEAVKVDGDKLVFWSLCVVSEINNTNWKSGKKYGNIQKRSNPAEATHEERKIASLKKGARVP